VPRGTAHLQQWEQNLIDERLDVVYTPACACGWRLEPMPLRDGRPLAEQHRMDAHPEIKVTVKRKRLRPFGQISGAAPLEDNIQKARQAGAATWASDESA
jgi:hypothetical protein